MNLTLVAQELSIVVTNHSRHEPATREPSFGVTYDLDANLGFSASSRHSIVVVDSSGDSRSCLLTSSGGASGVHEHSALVHDRSVVVAVGPHLCALRLPSLDLEWDVVVDDASCFGVHYSAKHSCYVSHGELTVSRVSLDGKLVWWAGGKDIFSEGFELHDDYATAIDFNGEEYRIDLATGDCSIVG